MVNEAEQCIMRRWTKYVCKQHNDRLDLVRSVYGVYRMSESSCENDDKGAAHYYDKREIACMLLGLIASGCLAREIEQDIVAVAPAAAQLALICLIKKENQVQRRRTRAEDSRRQCNLDFKAMTIARKRRITKKSAIIAKGVQPLRSRRPRIKKDNAAIAKALESALENDGC